MLVLLKIREWVIPGILTTHPQTVYIPVPPLGICQGMPSQIYPQDSSQITVRVPLKSSGIFSLENARGQ